MLGYFNRRGRKDRGLVIVPHVIGETFITLDGNTWIQVRDMGRE